MQKRWIQLGIVGKAHGLNGAFFISHRDSVLPGTVKSIRIGKDPEFAKPMVIKAVRLQNDRPFVQCEGIVSRTTVEQLVHQPIWCAREEIAIEDESEYFWADLVGMPVLDSNGLLLGKIADVQNYGASDIVVISDSKNRSLEIPFVDMYFDMNFAHDAKEFKLLVPADTFADTWNEA